MATDITLTSMRTTSRLIARLSFAAASVSLVLLAALHLLKPEFDPSWRMVSEYSIGNYGWVMQLVFLTMALSCVTCFIAIRSYIRTLGGYIGLAILLVTAAALAAAAIFTIDPITASKDSLTTHGNLHALASIIGVPGLPLAALLVSRSLARHPAWSSARRVLFWATSLTWISLLLMLVIVAVMLPMAGKFGPNVWIGWPNRLVMVAYSGWLMIVAWHTVWLSKQRSLIGSQFYFYSYLGFRCSVKCER
ncbi:hypothetical protein KDA_40520 [Dictyobacter alpinus]|uniref:DUF998 domain-containing protein n=1 Tax=Dictyobacter alpinus TaxID=2014873 RepID=A0A402BAW4_9CHLR|nr:DUF998 domain-containing protein [Dictyobacter alpinus]GCE28568.1 hypothetical protein KDA_40520 [Dictyobacter alpinus]